MRIKKILLFVVLLMLVGYSFSIAADGIQWYSMKDGMEKAKNEKKPCIVDFFYGAGCSRCEKLQKFVYNDPVIAKKIMADFIPIKIDLTKPLSKEEDALGKKFDYKNDCLLIFLDHNGEVISDAKGKRLCFVDSVDPEWFVSYLDMIKSQYK